MNPALLLNDTVATMYVSTTNMLVPLSNIDLNVIYNNVVEFGTNVLLPFAFNLKEAFLAVYDNISFTEKIILGICFYLGIVAVAIALEIGTSIQNPKKAMLMENENKFEPNILSMPQHSWVKKFNKLQNYTNKF